MGEAKRRKQLLGQGYWNPQTIGVYISKSHQTNKHMIWIGVRQGNDLQVYPITAHYKISAAWYGKTQVQEALKVFQGKDSGQEWFTVEKYGNVGGWTEKKS